MTNDRQDEAIHRAQLADMPLDVICAYLRERGYAVVPSEHEQVVNAAVLGRLIADGVRERATRFRALLERDRLPPGYPPLVDEDEWDG